MRGLQSIEAASFVSPKAVPQMADAAEIFANLPQDRGAGYEALVPNEKGYERAAEAGVTTVALVLATTDTFNRRNINMSLDEAIRVNEAVIRRAKADGIRARSYLSVVAACPYEGVVPPETVFDLAARMFDAGADELALGDSTGAGSPPQMAHLFETLAHRYGPERLARPLPRHTRHGAHPHLGRHRVRDSQVRQLHRRPRRLPLRAGRHRQPLPPRTWCSW